MNSLRSQLLVSSPRLPDPNFYRTVVLMIQHNEEGAFGVVLNRPSEVSVSEVWSKVSEIQCDSSAAINVGGPVSGPLMAIHQQPTCSEDQIIPGVYFATQKNFLDSIVNQEELPFRIFSGYAGWGGGQLEGELKVGGWLITQATNDYIFDESEDLWKRVAQDIGSEILMSALNKKHLPEDPSLN